MGRNLWAFVAFNFYSLFLISAFQENTAYLFDASLIQEMRLGDFPIDPRDWGWGGHYIWRLFSGVTVTAAAGFLAGAISKSKGAITALMSNIPSVLVWFGMIYVLAFTGGEVEGQTGFIVISIIAIPLTSYVAYWAGSFGEEVQRDEFADETVLGVNPYHWIWAVFPLYWYALGIVYVATKFIAFQFATGGDVSIVVTVMALLALAPVVAWIYPLRLVHRVLMGDLMGSQHSVVRALANLGILVLGMVVASGLQYLSYWLLGRMVS